jgi:hypothetical protein
MKKEGFDRPQIVQESDTTHLLERMVIVPAHGFSIPLESTTGVDQLPKWTLRLGLIKAQSRDFQRWSPGSLKIAWRALLNTRFSKREGFS